MSLGNRIKEIRKSLNQRQEDFAKNLSTNYGSVSDWERNKTQPNVETLVKIAHLGEKSLDWLLTGEEIKSKDSKDKKTLELLKAFEKLSSERKEKVVEYVKEQAVLEKLKKNRQNPNDNL